MFFKSFLQHEHQSQAQSFFFLISSLLFFLYNILVHLALFVGFYGIAPLPLNESGKTDRIKSRSLTSPFSEKSLFNCDSCNFRPYGKLLLKKKVERRTLMLITALIRVFIFVRAFGVQANIFVFIRILRGEGWNSNK